MFRRRSVQDERWSKNEIVFAGILGAAVLTIALPGPSAAEDWSKPDAKQIERGRELFLHVWKPYDPLCHGGDGLGPRFNEKSCVACHHEKGVGGGGPATKNVQILGAAVPNDGQVSAVSGKAQLEFLFPGAPEQPFVLHRSGTSTGYAGWRKKRLWFVEADRNKVTLLPADPQLVMPIRPNRKAVIPLSKSGAVVTSALSHEADRERIVDLERRGLTGDGSSLLTVALSERNTTALFGSGLLDQFTYAELAEVAGRQPPEVRGRPALLPDGRVGKFGWKAQNPTLLDFNMNACAVELGLNNSVHRQPRMNFDARSSYDSDDLRQEDCDALTAYIASLPQPSDFDPNNRDAAIGERLFTEIGCAQCHVRNLGPVKGIYSDLLLHRLGSKLIGHAYYGAARQAIRAEISSTPSVAPDEWRTPPLWGCADSAPYMHDGRAKTLEDAILEHADQGEPSVRAYRALAASDRRLVVTFLRALHAPSTAEKYTLGKDGE